MVDLLAPSARLGSAARCFRPDGRGIGETDSFPAAVRSAVRPSRPRADPTFRTQGATGGSDQHIRLICPPPTRLAGGRAGWVSLSTPSTPTPHTARWAGPAPRLYSGRRRGLDPLKPAHFCADFASPPPPVLLCALAFRRGPLELCRRRPQSAAFPLHPPAVLFASPSLHQPWIHSSKRRPGISRRQDAKFARSAKV